MLFGEADETSSPAFGAFFDTQSRATWLDEVENYLVRSFQAPRLQTPPIAKASMLTARSGAILTPDTELANMFLIEGERGCHRQCSFCVCDAVPTAACGW